MFVESQGHTLAESIWIVHASGLCTLPHSLRFLKEPRCHCSYERIGNLSTCLRQFKCYLQRQGILRHLKSRLEVVNLKSLAKRREVDSGTHIRCLPGRIVTDAATSYVSRDAYMPCVPKCTVYTVIQKSSFDFERLDSEKGPEGP